MSFIAHKLIKTVQNETAASYSSYLFVGEGSSNDKIGRNQSLSVSGATDRLMAIPVVEWNGLVDDPASGFETLDFLKSIKARRTPKRVRFPLVFDELSPAISEIGADSVELGYSDANGKWRSQKFLIEPRLAYFLSGTGTLTLIIQTTLGQLIASVMTNEPAPLMAVFPGSLASKQLDQIIDMSNSWNFVVPGNPSIFIGGEQMRDDSYFCYIATREQTELPEKIRQEEVCVACGVHGVTREHCSPNWLAKYWQVTPVTAEILCDSCNGFFGRKLEKPIAAAYQEFYKTAQVLSTLVKPVDLLIQWCLKTALLLSIASGKKVDKTWIRTLRQGRTPSGFEIYLNENVSGINGYFFSVTTLAESARRRGDFLFSMAINGLAFVVVRHGQERHMVPEFDRVFPVVSRADMKQRDVVNMQELHAAVLERMTGMPSSFTGI